MKIPLTQALVDERDAQAVAAAVAAGRLARGPIVEELERRFAAAVGASGAVATSSCTAALELALRALGVGAGDEVIVPSYTCVAVLNAVVAVGATSRLADGAYDVERMDYNVTPSEVALRRSPRTRAVIVPHMFGVPANIEEIVALGVPVIEDITLALGATHGGRPVGSHGVAAACSFHASKMITTGEGGALAVRDPELLERVRWLNGWESEQAAQRMTNTTERYQLRHNFNLSDPAAALGLSQLAKLPAFLARRRTLARRYVERLADVPGVRLPRPDGENVFFRFLAAIDRDVVAVLRALAQRGIEGGRGVYPPLHRFLGEPAEQFPAAERAVSTLLSIPLYPALGDDDAERLLDSTIEVLRAS